MRRCGAAKGDVWPLWGGRGRVSPGSYSSGGIGLYGWAVVILAELASAEGTVVVTANGSG
jgi:hypothetical protein